MLEPLENTEVLVDMWMLWKMWISIFLEDKVSKLCSAFNKKNGKIYPQKKQKYPQKNFLHGRSFLWILWTTIFLKDFRRF